jgi:hypothetical protein
MLYNRFKKFYRKSKSVDAIIVESIQYLHYCDLSQFPYRFKRILTAILNPIRADVRRKLQRCNTAKKI